MTVLKIVPRTTPRPPCDKPCASCPFRRDSMRGWLGAYDSPGHFLAVHYTRGELNPCHTTIEYDDPDWEQKFKNGQMGRACKGQAIFFSNSYKMPRPDSLVLQSDPDKDTVFSWPHEFLKHHGDE